MGQIISFLLNFLFPKQESTKIPAQSDNNPVVEEDIVNDEEPLIETNENALNTQESYHSTKSSCSDESNLSFQPPAECDVNTLPADFNNFEPKSYGDVAKVLDETIELLRGRNVKKTCSDENKIVCDKIEGMVNFDNQVVENIMEASGGSSSVATKDTKDFLFSDERKELIDSVEEEIEKVQCIVKSFENADQEKTVDEIKDGQENKQDDDVVVETNEKTTEAEDFNVVTNVVNDEQNTLELLQATLDDDLDDDAIYCEPITNGTDDVVPDLPLDMEIDDFDIKNEITQEASTGEALVEVFGEENREFINKLSSDIAKKTISNSAKLINKQPVYNIEVIKQIDNARGIGFKYLFVGSETEIILEKSLRISFYG